MSLHRLVLIAALAAPLALGAAGARGASSEAAAIDGVDVEQVTALAAGVPLRFAVYGTAHAIVTVRIEGGWHVLSLHENDAGIYEGTYVIDGRDAIVASSRVTATLQQGGQLASAALEGPLLLAAGPLPWADAAGTQPPVAAAAAAALPEVTSAAPLPGPVPHVAAAPITATSIAAPAPPSPAARTAPPPALVVARAPQRATCDDCGFVQSVRLVEPVPGGAIGALAGAIAGAVLGKELGEAHHQRMLSLLGALGGGLAGHEIGKQATQQGSRYEVVVRMRDGRSQVFRLDHAPSFGPGDTVRLGILRGEATPL
ncbi:MAG: hypothetical protein JO090_02370 [Rhizobacter sp.]|nr:hypothetical protein [Rhizobacter sp.]